MLSLLRKSTASMAKNSGSSSESFDFDEQYDVVEDLASWEFVNASHSDEEDLYSFEEDDVTSDELVSKPELGYHPLTPYPDDVISMQSLSIASPVILNVDVRHHLVCTDDDGMEEDVNDDDDGGGDDDGYGLDDELVPWKLKDRFGKQRIRKLGKRDGPKLSKSKKLPYYRNKPGCLYGKHGLGVRHFYI